MPFGWGSTWDGDTLHVMGQQQLAVTNAFRLGVHLGRIINETHQSVSDMGHQCLSAGGPLGTLRHSNSTDLCSVTNAFRLGVHLGPRIKAACISLMYICHQCLSAGGPLGTMLPWLILAWVLACVTNAFRLGVHLGRGREFLAELREERHQCLSAGGPLGTCTREHFPRRSNPVTNAFRLGVHLGPVGLASDWSQ